MIAVADREDETAQAAHFIVPDHHYLENWGRRSSAPESVRAPAADDSNRCTTPRAFEDTLLTWIRTGNLKASGLAAKIAAAPASVPAANPASSPSDGNTWHDYLRANWQETLFKTHSMSADFEQFWEGSLRTGVFDSKMASMSMNAKPASRTFVMGAATDLPKYKQAPSGVLLSLYPSIALGDGRHANNPWLQEMPDPISSVTWDNYLNVGPVTAAKLGVKNDDVAEVTSGDLSIRIPVRVQPGMHPSAVSIAVGYGRRAAGKVGSGCGVDVYPFVRALSTGLVFSGQPVNIRRTEEFYSLATLQWDDGYAESPDRERCHARRISRKPRRLGGHRSQASLGGSAVDLAAPRIPRLPLGHGDRSELLHRLWRLHDRLPGRE